MYRHRSFLFGKILGLQFFLGASKSSLLAHGSTMYHAEDFWCGNFKVASKRFASFLTSEPVGLQVICFSLLFLLMWNKENVRENIRARWLWPTLALRIWLILFSSLLAMVNSSFCCSDGCSCLSSIIANGFHSHLLTVHRVHKVRSLRPPLLWCWNLCMRCRLQQKVSNMIPIP